MAETKETHLDLAFVDEEYHDWAREEDIRERKYKLKTHYAVPVATNGQHAFVDYAIAELFYLMWRAGIQTVESCQSVYEGGPRWTVEEGHTAMICFRDAEAATLFLTLVAREATESGELNDRMTDGNCGGEGEMWEWDLFVTMNGRLPTLRPSALFPLLVDRLKKELA